jgi:hypothetical protein
MTPDLVRQIEDRRVINDLIADPDEVDQFTKWRPILIDRAGALGIYQLHR